MKLLVIEDDAEMRAMIARMLSPPYQVIEAKDGQEGIRLMASHSPALVITDIFMPEKDGLETIMEIRRRRPEIPVVAITGSMPSYDRPDYLSVAEQLGADTVLPKPFRAKQLVDAVNRVLAPRGA